MFRIILQQFEVMHRVFCYTLFQSKQTLIGVFRFNDNCPRGKLPPTLALTLTATQTLAVTVDNFSWRQLSGDRVFQYSYLQSFENNFFLHFIFYFPEVFQSFKSCSLKILIHMQYTQRLKVFKTPSQSPPN